MNVQEKYIARKLFQLEIHQRSGQDFENFFVKLMQYHNPNFQPVKPQGQFGDRKNDGFDRKKGVYYQVYSPQNPLIKEKETIEKLVVDFNGLYDYWNNFAPIKYFNYIVNDKYKGAYPSLYAELVKIENQYLGIECGVILAKDLEDIFMSFSEENIIEMIGIIPNPLDAIELNISVLNEVVIHLLRNETPYKPYSTPENPLFESKIKFNKLSKAVETLLRIGEYSNGDLLEYFRINSSNFAKEDLRQRFNILYKDALEFIPDEEGKSDLVFFFILEKASPSSKKVVQDAVLVLMNHYFTHCDIFEEPIISHQGSLF